MTRRQNLVDTATWHHQEAERLRSELATMTDGHKHAIGLQQVRRMEVDAETHQQLADEYTEYTEHVARIDELERQTNEAPPTQVDDAGLF
ncbi:hypothetical protein GCM10028801_41500 [Nocardioides maradonensis]